MTIEALQANIEQAIQTGYRDKLLSKGQARSIIMSEGVLPPGSPRYSRRLGYDLLSYGYSLLSQGLRLSEKGGDRVLARQAFEQAGNAIEAAVANDDSSAPEYAFHITIAAAAFHLGRFSARAFSLIAILDADANTSPVEKALALLMLRSIDTLHEHAFKWCSGELASDDKLIALLDGDEELERDGDHSPAIEAISLALSENFYGCLAIFTMALETGSQDLFDQADAKVNLGLEISAEVNLVPVWWVYRIARELLKDLWATSFHQALPTYAGENTQSWLALRKLFIASLYRRRRAEIELWPSQLEAAQRSTDMTDNLVASLPTSAGKTRIAELAILRCLAANKRVVFVTPLRALSAQTEASLQKTFGCLGYKISTLYGSIGSSDYEHDVLRDSQIVVATPEKIDFALRSDPHILDDVGLVILDEGHMIGLNEREIRYEAQIQRLLKRPDAADRRIVCLSAILPDGDQFEDFVEWLRRDEDGAAIVSPWRPTRVRFGHIDWQDRNDRGWLELNVEGERTFVPNFVAAVPPAVGRRTKNFPKDQHELVLSTTWKLVDEGHSVLIFCPIKKSVEPYAERILEAHKQGFISPLLDEEAYDEIKLALMTGREWFGEDHPILECLKLGVAIHHGSLPTPFRREVERLLQKGVLKVTVSSPTLAQGLNLSATCIIFHSIHRNREVIPASEFKNVVGRAGRAFVDVEGLVLFPQFDLTDVRLAQWRALIDDAGMLSMESGLLRLVMTFLIRIQESLGGREASLTDISEYILNNAEAWEFPVIFGERERKRQEAEDAWKKHLPFLDNSLLSLLGESDIPVEQIAEKLDEILASSLWERRLNRRSEQIQELCRNALVSRATYIWNNSTALQRKGYFLAGVGLQTGQQLDEIAPQANQLLVVANGAIINEDTERAIAAITDLAKLVFTIPVFSPEELPDDWEQLLSGWLQGTEISALAGDEDVSRTLRFIEDTFGYLLPWGFEALRVRGVANGDKIDDVFDLEDFELMRVVPALETGTLNIAAAVLMQSGFAYRAAAINAVTSTGATFTDSAGLKAWLATDQVQQLTASGVWPSEETGEAWLDYLDRMEKKKIKVWKEWGFTGTAIWDVESVPEAGTYIKLVVENDGANLLFSSGFEPLGRLKERFPPDLEGLLISRVDEDTSKVNFTYYGPEIGT